jgi:hypothetical protein
MEIGGWKRVFKITGLFYLYYALVSGLVGLLEILASGNPILNIASGYALNGVTFALAAALLSLHLRRQSMSSEASINRDSAIAGLATLFLPIFILVLISCISLLFGLGLSASATVIRNWVGLNVVQWFDYVVHTLLDLVIVYGAMQAMLAAPRKVSS